MEWTHQSKLMMTILFDGDVIGVLAAYADQKEVISTGVIN